MEEKQIPYSELRKQKKEEPKFMHEPTVVLGWILVVLSVVAIIAEINTIYSASILSFAITMFMFSKLIGVLEQIRDKL